MCVAVFKPAGAETPSLHILKECWDKNPDGAGVAVSERQTVYYRKGFMKFSELEDFYYANNLPGRIGQAMVFHFRIGTHGNKDSGNTHPFCMSDDPVILRTLTGRVSLVVAHNGIFRTEPKLPKISDTGQFIVDAVNGSGGDPVAHWNAHPDAVGWSKMVVLYPANRFKLLGSWSVESSDSCGCLFSNLTWKPYVAPKGGYYYRGYGYDCDSDLMDEYPSSGRAAIAVRVKHSGRRFEPCKACGGTGLASTGRVRCVPCNGTGYVWVDAETAAKDKPETKDKPEEKPAAGAIKVWSADKKDHDVVGAAK